MTTPVGPEASYDHDAMVQEAKNAVLEAVDLLDQAEVVAMLGHEDLGDVVGLLGLHFDDVVRYPTFQFDMVARTLRPIVLAVNGLLDPAGEDGWSVASWWISPDGRLGGAPPVSLLGTEGESRLLVMAHGEVDDW
ncbi:hypothetical protein [Georgenia yuyongxinii]